jgi:hypothetical protein
MKKFFITAGALVALAAAFAIPAMAGNGAVITNTAKVSIPGQTGYNFIFWNGNGIQQPFAPTYYQEVLTPSGVNNEVLKGTVANDTGAPVVYSAFSGGPIPSGQPCWDFATGNTSTDWQMNIDVSGNYTLTCHFPAAS